MAIWWNRIFTRVRFLCAQFAIVGTFGYLTFLWLGVFQRPDIIENSISVSELRKRTPQEDPIEDPIHSEAALSDKFGKKTQNVHSMDGCLEGWHLEVLREANGNQDAAQLCRSNDGSNHWQCAPGWRQLPADPFCVRASSPSKAASSPSKAASSPSKAASSPSKAASSPSKAASSPSKAASSQSKPADRIIRRPDYAQISDLRKLLFIHVPKAGGTSIETSFLFKEQRDKLGGHYLGGHHKIREFDKEFFRSYHKFGIVRHPCSRLISVWGYYSQDLGNEGDKKWADKFMNNVTKSSFDAFVKSTLYPDGPVRIDKQMHLQPQTGMVFRENGQFGLDQLLIFEKWGESMDELGKKIKEDITVLKSTHKLSSHHKTCKESYTPETWAKMTKLYAMDFCVLGYSTEFEEVNVTPPIDFTPETLNSRYQKCASEL